MCVGVCVIHLQVILADHVRVYVVCFQCGKCFLYVLMMSMASVMVPHSCPVFNMWFKYPELLF